MATGTGQIAVRTVRPVMTKVAVRIARGVIERSVREVVARIVIGLSVRFFAREQSGSTHQRIS